ncbi:MAG: hypothetical protein LBT92_01625 [Rickettsiales bacterium]|jgi:hypothetical protein|nr:hypothetical protein [Rickettsiales bacterium]
MTTYYKIENGKIAMATESKKAADAIGLGHETDEPVIYAWDGALYLASQVPAEPKEHRGARESAEAKARRKEAYTVEADPLKLDYDEAVARGAEDAEAKRLAWLCKKDKIRESIPVPGA